MSDTFYSRLATANTFAADQYFKSGRPWFDVVAFGADPTAATDSTLAIQTAVNTALGLRTDTGVSMSGFTVTDPAAVSGDVGKYVNSPNYPAIVTYAVGVTSSNATMQITGVASAPFVANQPVLLTAASAPAGFTSGTTYFILSPSQVSTTFSFSLSATSGGSAITPTTTGTTVTVAATTGGCSLITAVTSSPAGYTVATPAAASLTGQAVAVGTGSSVTGRSTAGPVFIPGGTYKITSDILVQSAFGFRLVTAGHNLTTLRASGGGFTTAILNIDGSVDGHYGGLQLRGDGTEGTGGVSASGIPAALNLTWTTSAKQSTSANTLEHIRVRNLRFVTGISLAGVGTRQLDGTQLQDIVVAGSQPLGGWSSSARTDTGVCGTSTVTPTTVTDTAAVTGDFGMFISGPGIPAAAKITAVTPGTGYTISANATATASGVTFVVGTGLWQAGFQFGNGQQGNIYDQVMYGCSASGCFAGYNCNVSSFALFSGQPAINGTDFVVIPGAQCTIENVQSQNSRQFFTASGSGSTFPVSLRDCEYTGYTGTGFSAAWISVDTLYGSLVLENMSHTGVIPSPVIVLGSANYHAQFTLINISQKSPPSSGIVMTSGAAVVAVNYSDTTAGVGVNAVLYPFYALNAGVLYQQGVDSARPAAGTFGELFYYATNTGALSHSNGSSWTSFSGTAPTPPDIQWITATGNTTWTKPSGAVTVQALLFGPGGGGGSGRRGLAGTIRAGGAGGGGGAVAQKQFAAADLSSTVTVTVSPGAAGGAAVTADSTNGNDGSTGSATSFGAFLSAAAGNPGKGGSATGANAGAGGVAGTTPGGPGTAASSTGAAGGAAGLAAGGAGGSSGGGITAADVPGNGAIGNNSCLGAGTQGGASNSAGGVVDTTSPTSGAQSSVKGALGVAGGSGAASITTAAQAAAASVGIAAGGSGGGASLNGNNSGAGGAGGPGAALIITFFQ